MHQNPLTRHLLTLAKAWLLLIFSLPALALPPDLTQPGVIATIDRRATYNLGPTGMRGWIYLSGGAGNTHGADGTMTGESRQILVTVASSPAADEDLQVDDVILGVDWGSGTGAILPFDSDARKAFGNAITQAEKTANGGLLRVKRWRPSDDSTVDVTITLPTMGTYATTAPYTCPKSAAILAAARTKLVGQLIANPNFLPTASNGNFFSGSISALALLSGVTPDDPDYTTVQARLRTYAQNMATNAPMGSGTWTWSYSLLFLSEYYFSTYDATVLPGIHKYALKMAQSQSMYGTFGHNPAQLRADGTGRMSCIGYGPVNATGVCANLSMVMAKKALDAGGFQAIDPQIGTAIQRGADYFAWYVNKGSVPYGEHHPWAENHGSNGKDQMAAVFFSQLDNRVAETEYFTRMSVAGFTGREYGHTGQGLSYLWEGLATHVGGPLALAEYYKNVLWHLDLSRRSDGSFAYDGAEQYGAGSTADGTYLGATSYHDLNPTASYLLTFSLPLKRLNITGKNANPAHTLDATKVSNAIAAATYKFDRVLRSNTQLIGDLNEFDPIVRNEAAKGLAARAPLLSTELDTLRSMLSGPNANGRMGACQTLGLLKDATAMTLITQRLDKNIETDVWVRATAANALRDYGSTANSQVNTMLTKFVENATDPETIVWNDPLQAGNSALSWALFSCMPGYSYPDFGTTTINAPKILLHPAVSVAFKQPDSAARSPSPYFTFLKMPIDDVKALPNDFITLIRNETQCDRMWSNSGRKMGIRTLAKYKFYEVMPLGLEMLPTDPYWGATEALDQAIAEIATYGESARWTLPTLRNYLTQYTPGSDTHTALVSSINSIEAATTSPTITYLKSIANGDVVTTAANTAIAINLTGLSCREPSVSFTVLTQPSHGTLTGTAPNLNYTPTGGYTGPDHFTFRTNDTLTTSEPATVGIVVGTAGTGLKGEYFNNADFSSLAHTRTDAQINFDWGTGSPDGSIESDTFSVRWSGQLLVPETGAYTFSALSNDGVRLYINGTNIIDNFVDQNAKWTDSAPIPLTKGQMVEIQMEYYENSGSAAAKLKWTGPSVAGQTGAMIPQAYLFDGSTIPNRTPYAHAQTVSTTLNTPKAITLTGSGGTLTYAVLSQPANGTLTGTAPHLTYTPSTNFSGTDSFTFLVNNGNGNSSPATVSITISAGLPVTYTWSSAVSGNMSTPASWLGGTAPAATGLPSCILNFTPNGVSPYTPYTATHDLNNGFQVNQLNFGGNVNITISGTNSLALSGNGGIQAQINQNSTNTVTITPPLVLAANTSFGGGYGGKVTLTGLISGTGALIKTNPGILQINNINNTYTGGTLINGGTVSAPSGTGAATPFLGTGPITLNPNSTLVVNRSLLSNAITLNGCIITGGNSFSSVFSGPVTLTGIATIDMGSTGGFQISGNISGSGGLTTVGTNQWTLNGTNTYTGATTIQAGIIRYQAVAAVAPGALDIANGGKANLNYTGNAVVTSLTLGGIAMPPGTYGSSASTATFKNDGYFTSTSVGTITILPPTTTALALTIGSSPATPGTPLTFTATVTGATPTGNVAFFSGTTLLGTIALNGSYQAVFTTSNLTSGTHAITARYLGNVSNASSTSNALDIVINSTVPNVPTNIVATPGNNQISLTWTASAGASGYYVKRSLTNGGAYTLIGNAATASYSDSTATNGTTYYYVISAYNGFGESADSGQISAIPTVAGSSTSLSSSPASSTLYGTTVTFTATVAVSGTPATGTVTFRSGTTVINTVNLTGGVATLATSALAAANHSITATYGGDVNYTTSASAPLAFLVTPKSVTIAGVTAADKVYDGTTNASLSGGSLSGVINGDSVTLIPGSGSFSDSNVGNWSIIASGYTLGGTHGSNYQLSAQPTVSDATITPRTIQITGTRPYDGTTAAPMSILTIANNVDEADLQLSGSLSLSAKDVGTRTLNSGSVTPVRVQSAKANTAKIAKASFSVNLTSTPMNGNTLVAVISTRGTSANQISGITGGGVTWTRVSELTPNTSGTTTEIWYGPNVSSGTTGITITTQSALRSAAVVMEYSGLLVPSSKDQTAGANGSGTSANTGTTAATTQAGELWIGGIGIASNTPTLGSITNSFVAVDNTATTASSAGSNARIYALERMVTATAAASTSGTLSVSAAWSGAIATFKATQSLTLTGAAAGNYTLTGMTGLVTITPKPLTVSGLAAANKVYDGTTTTSLTGTALLQTAQAPGAGSTDDGKPYTGDTIGLTGTLTGGSFADKHVGTNKPIAGVTGLTLTGAQAANYSLVPLSSLTASITQRAVTVTAVTATKTYDATTTATGTPTLSLALASGDATTTLSQSFQSSAVGSNKVIVPSITISDGNSGGNYLVTLTNFTTGTINPKNLTLTGITAVSKTYDGTTTAYLTGTAALQATQTSGTGTSSDGKPYTGDALTLAGTAVASFANKHAASGKSVTVSGYTISGAQASNYTLSQPTGLTANVTQLPLIVTAVTATKTYDATTTASGTPTLSAALAPGDTITSLSQTFEFAAAGIGNKTILPNITINDGNSGNNYAVTLTSFATATIIPKSLMVTGLSAENRNYNGTTTATITGTGSLLTDQTPGSGTTSDGKPYTGDTISLSGTPTGTFATKHVGNGKPVTIAGITLSGAQADNYTISQPTGLTSNITELPITVSGVNATKTYDGTTTATGTPTISPPLASGDTTTVLSQAYETATAGTNNKVLIPSIAINDGNNGANYAANPVNFTNGTIEKAPQTITFNALDPVLESSGSFVLGAASSSGLTVSYTSSNPSVASISGNTVSPLTAGIITITASQEGDTNYNAAPTVLQSLTILSSNPVASSSGPYRVIFGQSLSLNGSTSQAVSGSTITVYEWDLNNDGTFGDAIDATPSAIPFATLTGTWGMLQGINTIRLKVTDSENRTNITSTTVELVQNLTWDANGTTSGQTNGAGVWLNANQWWDGATNLSWVAGSNAVFGGPSTAGGTVTLASPTSAGSLTFNAFTGTYTLGTAGQALTISSGITANSSAGTASIISPVSLTNSQTFVVDSTGGLSTTGGLNANGVTITKTGNGPWTLSGDNTGANGTMSNTTIVVNAGNLVLGHASALGNSNNVLTLGGGNLNTTGSFTVAQSITQNWNSNFTFVGTSHLNLGTGPVTLGAATVEVNVSANNLTVGGIIGDGGNARGLIKSGNGTLIINGVNTYTGGTIINGGTIRTSVSGNNSILGPNGNVQVTINNVGSTLRLENHNITGTLTLNGGTLESNNGFGVTWNGSIILQSTSTLRAGLGGIVVPAVISGAGGLTKTGSDKAKTLNLQAANTFSGPTTNSFGSLTLAHSLALQNSTLDTTNSNGAVSGADAAYFGLKTTVTSLTLGGLSGNKNFDANVGSVFANSGSGYGSVTALTLNPGSSVTNTYSGGIANGVTGMTLTKSGLGTQILSGANTYTGTTNINQGKLFITGSLSDANAALNVANGATLGGTGTIGRNITIDAGGKLEFNISTDSTNHDRLDISTGRDFAFTGASELTITSTSGAVPGIYTLITGGNNISGSAPSTLHLPANWVATVSISNNSLSLNLISTTATPFVVWANSNFANGTLGNTSMTADPDQDGLPTGIEWVLGGDPTLASDATANKPVLDNTSDPDYLLYTYRRRDAANTDLKTSIIVEYGSDLTGWITASQDGTNILITPDNDFHGAGIDKVEVKIKRSLAINGKLFSRLRVVITP